MKKILTLAALAYDSHYEAEKRFFNPSQFRDSNFVKYMNTNDYFSIIEFCLHNRLARQRKLSSGPDQSGAHCRSDDGSRRTMRLRRSGRTVKMRRHASC